MTPLAAALEQQLSVSSGVTRWLEWMAALEKATLADFPHLARMAKNDPTVLRMVAARWIELNPTHLFETLIATAGENGTAPGSQPFPRLDLGHQLFENWSRRDPAGAVAALSRADLPVALKELRYATVNGIMNVDPEMGIKALLGWRMERYGVEPGGIARWAAANPQHAAEFALAHPVGYTTVAIVDVIGKIWAKTDPESALSFASGFKDKYGIGLATGIIKEWAAKDIGKAAAWLAAADPAVRNRLNGPMVEMWAKTDTAAAMDWIQQNLSGSSMDEALGSVLKGAAEKNITAAADLVTGMDASTGKAKGALAVARKWFPLYSSGKLVPPEAIAWMASLDPGSINHVVEQIQWHWAGFDVKGFADFLVSPAGEHLPEDAFFTAARELSRKNPVEALDWAARLPEARRSEAAVSVFMEWQSSQPAAALEWLRKLPASDPRRESFYLTALRDSFPSRPEASLAAKALASGNTAAAREAIQKLSIPDENKQKLMDRLQLK